MPHETALIVTIAAGFALAFLLGLLAVRLRLPPLVGYLGAGICVGPFTPGFVADQGLTSQLAEIGVILLMFGVGLHFSIRDLLAVRKIAIPGATVQIAVATALGAIVAHFWGWSWSAGLVFGLALSVASTVVLLRALEARGLLDSSDGRIAVGWLVIEDLVTVLALVLLPAIAAPMGGLAGEATAHVASGSLPMAIGLTILKVGLFLALMLFVGIRVVPWLLERVARTGSRELFTLAVLAVALGIAVGAAALFDVSFALGAFFAGVVISESDLSHQAAADALPLQDAFAVLFFVSVGMLFDPTVLLRQPIHVLATVLIILIGKSVAAFGIVLLFRYPVRTALVISASLAQIGEFSFILAGLGVSLGLIPEASRSLVLAGAIISITMNPVLFGLINPIEAWLRARPRLLDAIERKQTAAVVAVAPPAVSLHDHAIIIGYGRVGGTIGETLARNGVPYAVIERDRVMVESLRKRGIQSVFGDATRAGLLEEVHVETAKILIVTAPEPYHARRIVELARQINPDIVTVVRTHSDAERLYLEKLGVGRAVMGERELAFGISHFALVSLGRTDDEADLIIDGVRRSQSARNAESGTPA